VESSAVIIFDESPCLCPSIPKYCCCQRDRGGRAQRWGEAHQAPYSGEGSSNWICIAWFLDSWERQTESKFLQEGALVADLCLFVLCDPIQTRNFLFYDWTRGLLPKKVLPFRPASLHWGSLWRGKLYLIHVSVVYLLNFRLTFFLLANDLLGPSSRRRCQISIR